MAEKYQEYARQELASLEAGLKDWYAFDRKTRLKYCLN